MDEDQNNPTTATTPSTDQIRADRACVGCGFNLYGQSVSKEPHYGLAIARCPECGVVAALQQYPVMTHWVNRFRAILAGLYLVLLFAFLGLSTLAISAFAISGAELASEPLGDHIGYEWTVWTQEQAQAAQAAQPTPGISQTTTAGGGTATTFTLNGQSTTVTTNPVSGPSYSPGSYRWVPLTPDWIDNQLDASIERFGGLWTNKNPEIYMLMLPAAFVSLVFGIFWSLALLGSSRRRALLVPLASVLIGTAFLIGMNMDNNYYSWSSNVSQHIYVPLIVPVFMIFSLLMMAVGVWCGRIVARGVIRMALPPRARLPFAVLWTRDGLEPPRPTFG